MTEGNFVDYVKLFVTSGNGGSGSTHLRREKFVAKGGLTEAMVAAEDMLSFEPMQIFGHSTPSNLKNISVLVMENQEARVAVLALKGKMLLLTFPLGR